MSQSWQAVGNTVFDLTSRFEPQIYRFRKERVTAWPTDQYIYEDSSRICCPVAELTAKEQIKL